jgi:hypothetical protein
LKEDKMLNWGSLNQSNQHGGQSASAGATEKKPFREQQLDCTRLNDGRIRIVFFFILTN